MRRYGSPGADCSRRVVALTLYDYSEGLKLRIKSNDLDVADEIEYEH